MLDENKKHTLENRGVFFLVFCFKYCFRLLFGYYEEKRLKTKAFRPLNVWPLNMLVRTII